AVVDAEARHPFDHVQRRVRPLVGEEVGGEDENAPLGRVGDGGRRGSLGEGRVGGGEQQGGGGQQRGLGHRTPLGFDGEVSPPACLISSYKAERWIKSETSLRNVQV